MAVASWQGVYVTLWDLQSNEKIDECGTKDASTFVDDTYATFSADSRTLAYPSEDFKEVVLRDLETREERRVPGSFGLFSPTETVLVTLVEGNKLRLWDSSTLQPVADLPAESRVHVGGYGLFTRWSSAWPPGATDGEILILDMASRQLKATLRGIRQSTSLRWHFHLVENVWHLHRWMGMCKYGIPREVRHCTTFRLFPTKPVLSPSRRTAHYWPGVEEMAR